MLFQLTELLHCSGDSQTKVRIVKKKIKPEEGAGLQCLTGTEKGKNPTLTPPKTTRRAE